MDDKIFVSYARSDADFALKLARDLRDANVPIWIDQVDIPPGEPWDRTVEEVLRKCKSILVILSPNAVASRSVMDEVSFALDCSKRVLPIVFQNCEVPFRLRRLQHTDFTSNYSNALSKLMRALEASEGTTESPGTASAIPTQDFSPSRNRISGRRRLWAALCIGAGGGVLAAIAQLIIYANDERARMLQSQLTRTTIAGTIVATLLWTAAGWIADRNGVSFLSALSASLVVLIAWIAIGGTYNDVLWAAVVFGWPIGAILGAWLGLVVSKWRVNR